MEGGRGWNKYYKISFNASSVLPKTAFLFITKIGLSIKTGFS